MEGELQLRARWEATETVKFLLLPAAWKKKGVLHRRL